MAGPTMSPDEILEELSLPPDDIPREALIAADAHRDALTDPLLDVLTAVVGDPAGRDEDDEDEGAQLFSYALYLLAKWREPRAYRPILRWLSLPGELAFEIAGDIPTEDGPRILASVCGGDLSGIKALILNRRANEYGRVAGINAIACLTLWRELPRESVVEYFQWLAREGLEREPSMAWNTLAGSCADLELVEVFADLHRAFADGFIDPEFMDESDLDAAAAAPSGDMWRHAPPQSSPITDVADAIAWWAAFADEEPEASFTAVGRNDPCPCGSGKKFKKCHGA